MEGRPNKWSDIKDNNVKKDAKSFLKALDKGQVLGYSAGQEEFYIFDNEKDFKSASKGNKGKAMNWIKVESKDVDFDKNLG